MFRWNGNNLAKLIIIAPVLLAVIIIAGCSSVSSGSSVPSASTNGLVQSNTGGSVTIDVKWLAVANNTLTLDVSMDTHSVNLDQYDLKQLAILKDDNGNDYLPISWDSAAGAHHRTGKLIFTLPDFPSRPKYFELIIRNIAGIPERIFKWDANVT